MQILTTSHFNFAKDLDKLLDRDSIYDKDLVERVSSIIADVVSDGDRALVKYTKELDKRNINSIQDCQISQDDLKQAATNLDKSVLFAMMAAKERIVAYHTKQKENSWSYTDDLGITLGQKIQPIQSVGLYVPGGIASYPSSVFMNAIPAKIAGVQRLIACLPAPKDQVSQAALAALHIVGVDMVFTIGGAQAIAALAYGTETIPKTDKIVGPGNSYIAEAKRQVFGRVGIDMIAGPSEVLIIADDSANAAWIAIDLFAQAEHDVKAQAILVTPSAALIKKVQVAIEAMLSEQPRKEIIQAALENHGAFIQTASMAEAIAVANQVAPEHLELACENAEVYIDDVINAGAIFVGHASAESLGDYCAGPNHVLPTSGCARFASPLGVYDFVKRTSIIQCPISAAKQIAPIAEKLAQVEGLYAHAASAKARLH